VGGSSGGRRSLGSSLQVSSGSASTTTAKAKKAIVDSSFFKTLVMSERIMIATLSPEEIHDALKETWTTQGIVSGLISGITVEGLLSPPENLDDGKLSLDSDSGVLIMLWFSSTIFGLFSLLCSVFFYNTLSALPKQSGKVFLREFILLMPLPLLLMVASVFNAFCAIAYYVYVVYGNAFAGTLAALAFSAVPTVYILWRLNRGSRKIALDVIDGRENEAAMTPFASS